jgi:hypothetical protein
MYHLLQRSVTESIRLTECICTFHGSQNKQHLFPYTLPADLCNRSEVLLEVGTELLNVIMHSLHNVHTCSRFLWEQNIGCPEE